MSPMGEKKRRLAAQPPGAGPFDGRLLARAFEALGAGDRVRAAEAFATLHANLPRDPEALNGIGVLGLQLGDPQRAAGSAAARRRGRPAGAGVSLSPGDRLPESRQARARHRGARNGAGSRPVARGSAFEPRQSATRDRRSCGGRRVVRPGARAAPGLSVRAVRARRSEARAGPRRGGCDRLRACVGTRSVVPRGALTACRVPVRRRSPRWSALAPRRRPPR